MQGRILRRAIKTGLGAFGACSESGGAEATHSWCIRPDMRPKSHGLFGLWRFITWSAGPISLLHPPFFLTVLGWKIFKSAQGPAQKGERTA